MTLLKIAQMGHPVLLRRADPVVDVEDGEIGQLIDDMIETMLDVGGVGLAAPQVYRSLRLFVARRADFGEEMDHHPPLVIINPVIEPLSADMELGVEGCLSIPGLRGMVPRSARVKYSGLDRYGKPIEGNSDGFFARILQHEYDHLDGILYTSRLSHWSHIAMDQEAAHLQALLNDPSSN